MRRSRALVATIAAVAALGVLGVLGRAPAPTAPTDDPRPPTGSFRATVLWVTDGDTIGARASGGSDVRVRIIGVDTPETKRPGAGVQCFGREATAELARLIPPGSAVTAALQRDRVDRYGRDLWDVWLPDGRLVSSVLVSGGFGRAAAHPGTDRDAVHLAALEESARASGQGLWSACPTAGQPVTSPSSPHHEP